MAIMKISVSFPPWDGHPCPRDIILDPNHALHKLLPEVRQVSYYLRGYAIVPIAMNFLLQMTGSFIPCTSSV